ncbi:hypothetical protein DYQ93_16665 [Xanthomonas sp. LMG 8992]|uniref:RHS repeat domain-containing protein n=1 Tax=Xanthomonas sp. LMG 8992 TaxID=1591157 RepID=UPI0013694D63|nr:RHS repeat-associated core domain-containing protein [Xanthomonas sp. LMG 8992]MXV12653.1 hypothetical protein [Xanthomonas sp. LMG 8992]
MSWIGVLWVLLLALPVQALAETVEYFHTDALGTPIAVTDASGNLIETSEYEPYGKLLNRPVTDGPGFTGHVQDAATGLTYMQQRYYDPVIGKFLSVDPVAANMNNGVNFNRYKYATNNPYKFIDPDGRSDVNYFYGGNFMGLGADPLYSAAERFDIPGFTTVMGHSWDRGYRDDREAIKGPEVSYNSLKNDIAQNYKKGDYIFLGGCHLGFGSVPRALARDFNTKVLAGTGYVRRGENKDGDITYTVNSKKDGTGYSRYFEVFNKDGSSGGRIGSVTQKSDGTVSFTAVDAPTGSHIRPVSEIKPGANNP